MASILTCFILSKVMENFSWRVYIFKGEWKETTWKYITLFVVTIFTWLTDFNLPKWYGKKEGSWDYGDKYSGNDTAGHYALVKWTDEAVEDERTLEQACKLGTESIGDYKFVMF